MIAVKVLWRYLPGGALETVQPGERCDWTRGGVYEHLGRAVPVEEDEDTG